MKQALKEINEIKRLYKAIQVTNSQYLRNDYMKKICSIKQELKEYCSYKGINYKSLEEVYGF